MIQGLSWVSIQNHGEEYTENFLIDQLKTSLSLESARESQVISELIVHIQRLSLLGDRPKSG